MIRLPAGFLPSPPVNGFHIGPLFVHAYGLAYVVAVIAAVTIAVRRWEAKGGERDLVYEVALFPLRIARSAMRSTRRFTRRFSTS